MTKRLLYPILILGFAIFSMFFGAGNVIYPMHVGYETSGMAWLSLIGFLITGVGAPLLGLYAILLSEGNLFKFFSESSPLITGLWIAILVLALGPIGATPRCVLLSYQALKSFMPGLTLPWFSLILGGVLVALTLKKTAAIDLLGKLFSPLLLVFLLSIIYFSLIHPAPITHAEPLSWSKSITTGITEGYQTMDLLAALIFAVTLWKITKFYGFSKQETKKVYFYAMTLGGFLLGVIYFGLGLAAQSHEAILSTVTKDLYLNTMAYSTLGHVGGSMACLTVFLACFTTIIALLVTCCDCALQWFEKTYEAKPARWYPFVLITLIVLTLFSANLGFDMISSFISAIVNITYPVLILLAIIRIAQHHTGFALKQNLINFFVLGVMGYQSWQLLN